MSDKSDSGSFVVPMRVSGGGSLGESSGPGISDTEDSKEMASRIRALFELGPKLIKARDEANEEITAMKMQTATMQGQLALILSQQANQQAVIEALSGKIGEVGTVIQGLSKLLEKALAIVPPRLTERPEQPPAPPLPVISPDES